MSNAPRLSQARRDWGSDDTGCPFMHVDMDAFFASVEVARHPELRGLPVVVGGGERSVVLAATYEAREFGVRSAMPVVRAKTLAPKAIFIQPDHHEYRRVSRGVMEILAAVTPEMEQVSVDEAFLDISGSRRRLGSALDIGSMIREQVFEAFGVTCSVGIARNKFVAKLASTQSKPNGLMLVPDAATTEFLHMLPVGALWGVGAKTQERLGQWGVTSVEQVAHADIATLERMVGRAGARHLHALAWGKDSRAIEHERVEKSIGSESTFFKDQTDTDVLLEKLLSLADECGSRLRSRGLVAKTVAIKVRDADFVTVARSVTLPSATDTTSVIYQTVRELFLALPRHKAVRLLGVRAENLESADMNPVQDTLEDAVAGAAVAMSESEKVMDEIRAKFGQGAINRAAQRPARLSSMRVSNYP